MLSQYYIDKFESIMEEQFGAMVEVVTLDDKTEKVHYTRYDENYIGKAESISYGMVKILVDNLDY